MRPQQWLKNVFIFVPLFFSQHLLDAKCLLPAVVVFFAFSFAASGVYCFNDTNDVAADRKHPRKCKRPVASGAVSKKMAFALMFLLFVASFLLVLFLPKAEAMSVSGVIIVYILLNIAYSLWLKRYALVDMLVISLLFVLRILAGGLCADIWISQWIVLMTFLLALFLVLAKRRDDVVIFEKTGVMVRESIKHYSLSFINYAIVVVASVTIVCYIMYTVSDDVEMRMHTQYLYTTTIFVLAGILRYLQLTVVNVKSGSPTKVLLKDTFIQLCVLGWITFYFLLIYI